MKTENEAIAKGMSLPVSFKQSVEVCRTIRGKPVNKAIALLERVIKKKNSIEFKRFNRGGLGHKESGPSRYPINTCTEIIKLLKNAQANAEQKGLNKEGLLIKSILANKASNTWHYGRQRRRRMKRTHLEITVKETEKKKEKKETKTAKEVPKKMPVKTEEKKK